MFYGPRLSYPVGGNTNPNVNDHFSTECLPFPFSGRWVVLCARWPFTESGYFGELKQWLWNIASNARISIWGEMPSHIMDTNQPKQKNKLVTFLSIFKHYFQMAWEKSYHLPKTGAKTGGVVESKLWYSVIQWNFIFCEFEIACLMLWLHYQTVNFSAAGDLVTVSQRDGRGVGGLLARPGGQAAYRRWNRGALKAHIIKMKS